MVIFGPKNIFELSLIELAGRTTDLFKLYKSGLILVETGPSISKCRKITTKSYERKYEKEGHALVTIKK